MNIVHIELCDSYNDGWGYHDNLFPIANKKAGHNVSIITNCMTEKKDSGGVFVENKHSEYIDENGISIYRLSFKYPFLKKFNRKIRCYEGLYKKLCHLKPDAIFVHNIQFLDIYKITKYKKTYPSVNIYADSHSDSKNSAQKRLSKLILHKFVYKKWITDNKWIFNCIYYIALPTRDFLIENYALKEDELKFLSLGGCVREDKDYQTTRHKIRNVLNINNKITLLHTGKMNDLKKTYELLIVLNEFLKQNDEFKMLIVGCFSNDIKSKCIDIIRQNDNIEFLGWKNNSDLEDIMCASDILIQPGSLSAVFQVAICNRMVPILDNVKNNQFLTMNNNGFVVDEVEDVISKLIVLKDRKILNQMKENSFKFAKEKLSYDTQTKEVFQKENFK